MVKEFENQFLCDKHLMSEYDEDFLMEENLD